MFSHSVILISVSAQYLEKERMEFDKICICIDIYIPKVGLFHTCDNLQMATREIRLSFQGNWVLHQGGFDGMFKTSLFAISWVPK